MSILLLTVFMLLILMVIAMEILLFQNRVSQILLVDWLELMVLEILRGTMVAGHSM